MAKNISISSDGTCKGTKITIGKTNIKAPMYFRVSGYSAEKNEVFGDMPDEIIIEAAMKPKDGIVQTYTYRAKDGKDVLTAACVSEDISAEDLKNTIARLSKEEDGSFAIVYTDGYGMKRRELPHHSEGGVNIDLLHDSLMVWQKSIAPKTIQQSARDHLVEHVEVLSKKE